MKLVITGAAGCGKSLSTLRQVHLERLRAYERALQLTARWIDAVVDNLAARPRFAEVVPIPSGDFGLEEVFQESAQHTQCGPLAWILRSVCQTVGITRLKDRLDRIREMLAFLSALIRFVKKLLRRASFIKTVFLLFEEFFFTHGEPRPPQVNASNGMRWPVVA